MVWKDADAEVRKHSERCAITWMGAYILSAARSELVMSEKRKSIPVFKSEAEERTFWESHDSTDYVDWSEAKRVRFPNSNLRPRRFS